ncbi:hypothetical protein CIPAW_16G111500 [Carya illinoinensis]|uniref:Uncharacterized protein n=1 Tax=Carya illinoinensis TaxID=32201 RepID=A0A8T1N5Q4_CARIL|nr:hypothetical protein CIPAW_16G111500 [Carya illinoinensis]
MRWDVRQHRLDFKDSHALLFGFKFSLLDCLIRNVAVCPLPPSSFFPARRLFWSPQEKSFSSATISHQPLHTLRGSEVFEKPEVCKKAQQEEWWFCNRGRVNQ